MVPNGTSKGTFWRGCGTSVENGRVEKILPEMFETIREEVITNRKNDQEATAKSVPDRLLTSSCPSISAAESFSSASSLSA